MEQNLGPPGENYKKCRKHFDPETDLLLFNLVQKHGMKWGLVSKHLKNWSSRQCRDRYLNYLRPDINTSKWDPEEDELLCQLVEKHGTKWAQIVPYFNNRTQVNIKNRYANISGAAAAKMRNVRDIARANHLKSITQYTPNQQIMNQISETNQQIMNQMVEVNQQIIHQMSETNQQIMNQMSGANQQIMNQMSGANQQIMNQMSGTNQQIMNQMSGTNQQIMNQMSGANQQIMNQMSGTNQQILNQMSGTNQQIMNQMSGTNQQIMNQMSETNQQIMNQMIETNEQIINQFNDPPLFPDNESFFDEDDFFMDFSVNFN